MGGPQLGAGVPAPVLAAQPFAVQEVGAGRGRAHAGTAEPLDRLAIAVLGGLALTQQGPLACLGAKRPVGAAGAGRLGKPLESVGCGGNPTINPFINPDGEKNLFNSRQPADDVANYLQPWSAILQNAGGYTPEQATAAALQVLPDILHYDNTQPATYPNGRILTDDVYSLRFAWLTNGKVPPSGLTPHDDLLAHFPYLGPPNP